MRRLGPGLLALALIGGCSTPRKGPGSAANARIDTTVDLGGRRLDLAPFLVGYPHEPLLPLWDEGRLLVDHQGAARTLRSVPADFGGAPPDLDDATLLTDIDWDSRNRWGLHHHAPTGMLYWQGDAVNDEKIDLWRMPTTGGTPERLTDEPYLYGFSFSPEKSEIALLPRRGDGPFQSCLERMDIASGTRTPVICDTPEASFTWSQPSWSPDGAGVLVRVNLDGERSRGNLAWIDLQQPSLRLLLDPAPDRRTAFALEHWLDDHTALVVVDDDQRKRIATLDVRTATLTDVWVVRQELQTVDLLRPDGQDRLVIIEHGPVEDTLYLVDPTDTGMQFRATLPGSVSWLGDDETDRILLALTSATTPMDTRMVRLTPDSASLRPWLGLPEPVEQAMVACDVEQVSIPTFDPDPATGQTRELHAFLYTPRQGPPRAEQSVRITAFYGGSNSFREDTQIHCAAGIATLSPAVRGSWGFGPAFYALNDGDLGGDEIVDLFEAARWLESQGFTRGRIGVHGGSHGGYATLRALTFPPGTNAHAADAIYPLAFGVSRAGFSDIVTFHDTCNIPDWVVLEAGDPVSEADKLRDRSPLSHVDRLQAPVLLVHGENDSRVPVAESRQMAQACAEQGKDCVYVEFPGMGHHIKGLANQTRQYQATFDLIRRATNPDE